MFIYSFSDHHNIQLSANLKIIHFAVTYTMYTDYIQRLKLKRDLGYIS